jgi:uncharacterized protein
MEWHIFVLLATVTVLGSAVQTAFGFGFAILAAPLFLVVMSSTAAVPVLAVLNLAASAIGVIGVWKAVTPRLFGVLCLGSAAGFPLGLALHARASVADLKLTVGVIIMLFALCLLARERGYFHSARNHPDDGTEQKESHTLSKRVSMVPTLFVGIISGSMSAAFAMPGPAAMLFLSTLHLEKQESRAVSLALFTFSYASSAMLHAAIGSFSRTDLFLSAGLLPFVLFGALAGGTLARHISEAAFRQWVLCILFIAGFYAVLSVM